MTCTKEVGAVLLQSPGKTVSFVLGHLVPPVNRELVTTIGTAMRLHEQAELNIADGSDFIHGQCRCCRFCGSHGSMGRDGM